MAEASTDAAVPTAGESKRPADRLADYFLEKSWTDDELSRKNRQPTAVAASTADAGRLDVDCKTSKILFGNTRTLLSWLGLEVQFLAIRTSSSLIMVDVVLLALFLVLEIDSLNLTT